MDITHTTTDKEKKMFVIYHGNRLLIATLSFIGLILDGYQLDDLIFGCSVILWIWLPEIDALEKYLLNKGSKSKSL